jgi:hypothetical protein
MIMNHQATSKHVPSLCRVATSCVAVLLLLWLAEPAMAQSAPKTPSVEATPKVVTFQLRWTSAPEMADVISDLYGGAPTLMRVAADQRTNRLILSADSATLDAVGRLLGDLDTREFRDDEARVRPTLQLRLVWFLDGLPEGEGQSPSDNVVSTQVVEALQELGFESPRVVLQHVTTLTPQEQRGGRFQFAVPVLVQQQVWRLMGRGTVSATESQHRFTVDFDVQLRQAAAATDSRVPADRAGELGGSIEMPRRHYTVIGATTFVAGTDDAPRQHPSAFVLFLDDAAQLPRD